MRRWTMERGSFQGYAASLERTMQTMHLDLGEAMYELQELCPLIAQERNVPAEIVTDIRQTYKRIQDQLTKIRGVKQLLEGKYRQYYHRDSQREREILEFAFLAKSLYSKFECALQEIETKGKLRDREEQFWGYPQRMPFSWFQSKGNQITLLRNLRDLCQLDYKTHLGLECEQRRERNGMRSISLFVMSGEAALIHHLQFHMRLREYDIKERSAENECRGALTHLKEISLLDVESVIRRFTGSIGFSKVKCLLLRIQSQKDLEKEIIGSIENVLRVTEAGSVRTLSI
jgi:hypothetical protein